MNELEKFLSLLFKRLVRPFVLLLRKLYRNVPQNFKKHVRRLGETVTCNLELIILMIILLVIFVSTVIPRNSIDKIKLQTSRWPLSISNHLSLATIYFNNGNLAEAQKELVYSQNLYKFFKFFDLFDKTKLKLETATMLINQPLVLQQQIDYWTDLLQSKPNFLEAYLHLSLYEYQLGNMDKANENYQKAFYLDPNSEMVKKLGKLVISNE